MKQEHSLKVLLAPHITEKSVRGSGIYPQYAFKVLRTANKVQVRDAVEQLFNVKVRSVQICNIKERPARFGRTLGRHKAWKKAYVVLNADQQIDLAGVQG